jgi:hypothetical protein|tara:strand:+ start:13421 stop:14248 length:828 start_codon:yes stop_codon:yes gene_type:complete
MFGNYFYHERTRKGVSTFGKVFNDIYVLRKDSTGKVVNQIKVPLSYAPRQKFLERIKTVPNDGETHLSIKLPRMSFEITGISYDTQRQLPKGNFENRPGSTNSKRQKFRQSVPYIMNYDLNVYAKNQDDALQIVEQILPYFNPQYTLTVKPFGSSYNISEDVPIILTGVSMNDDYEGDVSSRRTIIYTLSFDMHANFYGPINEGGIVRKAIAPIAILGASTSVDSNGGTKITTTTTTTPLETITITPTPSGVSPDSDFGFNETIILASDSDAAAI